MILDWLNKQSSILLIKYKYPKVCERTKQENIGCYTILFMQLILNLNTNILNNYASINFPILNSDILSPTHDLGYFYQFQIGRKLKGHYFKGEEKYK